MSIDIMIAYETIYGSFGLIYILLASISVLICSAVMSWFFSLQLLTNCLSLIRLDSYISISGVNIFVMLYLFIFSSNYNLVLYLFLPSLMANMKNLNICSEISIIGPDILSSLPSLEISFTISLIRSHKKS